MQSGTEASQKFKSLCACQNLKPAFCVLLTNTRFANKLVHVNCVTEATISLFVIQWTETSSYVRRHKGAAQVVFSYLSLMTCLYYILPFRTQYDKLNLWEPKQGTDQKYLWSYFQSVEVHVNWRPEFISSSSRK